MYGIIRWPTHTVVSLFPPQHPLFREVPNVFLDKYRLHRVRGSWKRKFRAGWGRHIIGGQTVITLPFCTIQRRQPESGPATNGSCNLSNRRSRRQKDGRHTRENRRVCPGIGESGALEASDAIACKPRDLPRSGRKVKGKKGAAALEVSWRSCQGRIPERWAAEMIPCNRRAGDGEYGARRWDVGSILWAPCKNASRREGRCSCVTIKAKRSSIALLQRSELAVWLKAFNNTDHCTATGQIRYYKPGQITTEIPRVSCNGGLITGISQEGYCPPFTPSLYTLRVYRYCWME